MYALKTRYIVFEIPCSQGNNIKKISEKIPQDFVLINGFRATVRRGLAGEIPDAVVSLSFNNKMSNPIIESAEKNSKITKNGSKYYDLNEQIQDGTYIQGYVESATALAGNYSVKITLRGKKIIKTD